MTSEIKPEDSHPMTDDQIIAIAKNIFGCDDVCLSGRGPRDREVTVAEYPIGEGAIEFARAILSASADQVRAAVLAERRRCEQIARDMDYGMGDLAEAIRSGK